MHIVDEPEDGLSRLRFAEEVTLGSTMHLTGRQLADIYPRQEEIEVVIPAGFYHRHGGQHEIDRLSDLGFDADQLVFE